MDALVKTCRGCLKTLPTSDFHKSKRDGFKSKCKICRKIEAKVYRDNFGDLLRTKDNVRNTDGSKKPRVHDKTSNKYKAQYQSNNAIKSGFIKRLPCEVCGKEKSHGHHDDYLKIFELRFLCARHHRVWHLENGEGKNA